MRYGGNKYDTTHGQFDHEVSISETPKAIIDQVKKTTFLGEGRKERKCSVKKNAKRMNVVAYK